MAFRFRFPLVLSVPWSVPMEQARLRPSAPYVESFDPLRVRLRVAGLDVQAEPLKVKQVVAYVPDDPPLFETLTVWEHLRFIASAYQVEDYQQRGADAAISIESRFKTQCTG